MRRVLTPLALAVLCCAPVLPLGAAEQVGSLATLPRSAGNTLEDFYNATLNYSPRLIIARERWNVGTARKQAATGQLLPQVNATANVSDNNRDDNVQGTQVFTGERYALQISQVLFNWQAFAARSQASLLEDRSEAEYYAEVAAVLTEIADRYLAVLQAEDAVRSLESEREAMQNQVNQIQRLYDLQLARITDLYDGQARIAAVQAELVNTESDLMLAREALRATSGLEVGDLARLPEAITVPPLEGEMSVWLDRARANNRLIEARALGLQAAEQLVSERRGAYMPRVSLVLVHQQSNVGFENIPVNEAETNYVGIDVTVPLYAGGRNRAGVREAESQRVIAESELQMARLEILEQARSAWLQVRGGEARIEAGRILAESTDTSYTAMQRGFELGTVTSVEVLNALRDRFSAQRQLQQARYDHLRAHLALRRDAGVLGVDDILEVSRLLNER